MIGSLLLCGCTGKGPNSSASSSSDDGEWLVVSTDAGDIEAAKRLAKESDDKEYEAVFAAVAQPDYFWTHDELNTLNRRKEESLRRLTMLAGGTDSPAAVGAGLVLCQYLQPTGREKVVAVLEKGSADDRIRVIRGLEQSWTYDDAKDREFRDFLNGDERLRSALVKQLDDGDPKVVEAAIQTCGQLQLPGLHEKLLALLRRGDAPAKERILFWMSRGPLTAELLEAALHASKANANSARKVTAVFEAFTQHEDPKLREPAREELKRQLATSNDNGIGFEMSRVGLITTLAKMSDARDRQWLQESFERERGMYAAPFLAALVRLDGAGGKQRLISLLQDNAKWSVAVQAIEELYKDSGDAEVIGALVNRGKGKSGTEVDQICGAILAVGGEPARAGVEQLANRLDAVQQSQVRRRLSVLPLKEIAARAVEAGLLSQQNADQAIAATKRENDADQASPPGLSDLLSAAKLLIMFDAEADMVPCRHDRLVADFAAHSGGKFSPEAINEKWLQENPDDEEAEYDLQFVHGGQLFRGRLQNLGDWYDVKRVSAMINQALADAGGPERFVALDTGEQMASFVFADPKRLEPVAAAYDMPLSTNPDKAREVGREYEQQVFEKLKESENW